MYWTNIFFFYFKTFKTYNLNYKFFNPINLLAHIHTLFEKKIQANNHKGN